ncbi:SRPBCC family protein [Dactylosporangium sp. NPDC049742]|uniref:SRPBCC family protein n=1 Tax=Dactylosporangium sp. NPDC049742 TaxID=3154737 RepID=UPI003416D5F1
MWEYEYAADSTVDAGALWALWSDVGGWPRWNSGVERIEIDGPFAAGTAFRMTGPGEDEAIEMRLTEVVPGERFTDEMDAGDFVVRTEHRIERTAGGTRVVYRTEITGPAAGEIGPRLGPAITGDFPDVVAALIAQARVGV